MAGRGCFHAVLVAALALSSGCVITSRWIAGYGAAADSGSCGWVPTVLAIVVEGAVAGAVLASDVENKHVVVIGLGVDTAIGGIMAVQDCTRS